MGKIQELRDKKVAILGLGASQIDYVIGVENSKTWDEVWTINSALAVFECDRVFMMDPASRFLDTDDAGNQTDVMRLLPRLCGIPSSWACRSFRHGFFVPAKPAFRGGR